MKKIDQHQQGSAKQLELHRETLRRLDTVDLQNIRVAGARASIIRPTTDP
jgi:hypothetical protein